VMKRTREEGWCEDLYCLLKKWRKKKCKRKNEGKKKEKKNVKEKMNERKKKKKAIRNCPFKLSQSSMSVASGSKSG